MKGWRWRVVLAVIGLVMLISSACLVATSRLQVDRRIERDTVPIEAPPAQQTPESHRGTLCAPLLVGVW